MWYTFCAKPMILIDRIVTLRCRSPCGERGLKWKLCGVPRRAVASLPVRGAWIEIFPLTTRLSRSTGRSPCGERGLKSWWGASYGMGRISRSPCGERGLKSQLEVCRWIKSPSLPVRGAWIEIITAQLINEALHRRSPCGERGLKLFADCAPNAAESRSPCGERGLKCDIWHAVYDNPAVAPRAGSVD